MSLDLSAKILFVAIIQFVLVLSQAVCAKEQALVLSGKSSEFASVNFKISSTAINAQNQLGMLIWTASDPVNVISLNSETKVFLHHPFADWRLSDDQSHHSRPLEQVELVDTPVLCGQKCNHYMGYRKRRGQTKPVPAVEFWCMPKSPCPPLVLAAWCALFKLPAEYGFPIQVKQASNGRLSELDALSAEFGGRHGGHWGHVFSLSGISHASADTMTTKPPAKYKAVKDKAGLMFGRGGSFSSSDMDDLFGKFKP